LTTFLLNKKTCKKFLKTLKLKKTFITSIPEADIYTRRNTVGKTYRRNSGQLNGDLNGKLTTGGGGVGGLIIA